MIVIQLVGLLQEVEDDCCIPTSTLSNMKSSHIPRKEKIVFTTVVVVTGLTGILFVDIHNCSTSTSGIYELNALLQTFHLSFPRLSTRSIR